ncbi:MAG: hypothetical protein P8I91_04700 [Phycisphaerales bacterium]|nr:hypothetical protein [Phycisphaerales bacterium]
MSAIADRITCASLTGPWLEGLVTIDGDQFILRDEDAIASPCLPRSQGRTVIWSGNLGPDRFVADPRSWLATGWAQLEHATESLPRGTLLRPHAAHVLSDAMSARKLGESDLGVELALSPASMMAESMLDERDDHLVRIFEFAAAHAALLILEDLDCDLMRATHAGEGSLDGKLLGQLIDTYLPLHVPIITAANNLTAAARWLHL